MLAVIAAFAAFVAVAAVFAWASGLVRSPVEARLDRLSPSGEARRSADAPFADRVFIPVLDGFTRAFITLLPHRLVQRVDRQLLAAGSPLSPLAFFTIVIVAAIGLPAVAAFLLASSGGLNALSLMIVGSIAAGGLVLPFVWLARQARLRRLAIWRGLADAFDMVTVCVEAGLGLDAALRQVSSKAQGPLADEVAVTLRQVGMGRPRREALEDLAHRVDIPEMTTFVNAVIQAEQLGSGLGRVLRAQSQGLRTQRRQKAEDLANKAPVKMVFPLVVFMLPTFFIVTIGPIIIHILNYSGD